MPEGPQAMAVNFAINVVAPQFHLEVSPDWRKLVWTHKTFVITVFLDGEIWKFSSEEDGVKVAPQEFPRRRFVWTIQGLVDNYRNVKRF